MFLEFMNNRWKEMSLAMLFPVAGRIQSQLALPSHCLELLGIPQPSPPLSLTHIPGWGLLLPRAANAMERECGLWSRTIRAQILAPAPPCCGTLSRLFKSPQTYQISRNNLFLLQHVFIEHLRGARHCYPGCRCSRERNTKEGRHAHLSI